MATIYTIGHSTRTLDELISALKAHGIRTLIDIRAFPASRRLPHFNREPLTAALTTAGIGYLWEKRLGGYRKKVLADSPNVALRNQSFRNYADYMLSGEFQQAIDELIAHAGQEGGAIMCAERLWFRCHRMLVSDWLVAHGHTVLHIDGIGPLSQHRLTPEAQLEGRNVIYREKCLF
ncbi:MAG TPA: DUF488 domain-containing protein [Terriglobales bacterium]|nr:DUF488 domain-containing protein [Terriglobales bacterium]